MQPRTKALHGYSARRILSFSSTGKLESSNENRGIFKIYFLESSDSGRNEIINMTLDFWSMARKMMKMSNWKL